MFMAVLKSNSESFGPCIETIINPCNMVLGKYKVLKRNGEKMKTHYKSATKNNHLSLNKNGEH
jgi:hypothetical protein